MGYIITDIYKNNFTVYPAGCSGSVSWDAEVLGVENVNLYDTPIMCNENPVEYKALLKVQDPVKGTLWIDETVVSFADKIASAAASGTGGELDFNFKIGDGGALTPLDGTTEYNNPDFAGASLEVYKNGYGLMEIGVDIDILPTGGFELLGGAVFTTNVTYYGNAI